MKFAVSDVIKKIVLTLSIVLLCSCKSKKNQIADARRLQTIQNARQGLEYINLVKNQKNQAVETFIDGLPLEEKVAQLFVVNLVGCDEFIPVEENIAGGFLYFGYNIAQTPFEMQHFNQSVINYCKANGKIPPFLTVDQEGGFVNRLRSLNGPLPSAQRVSEKLDVAQTDELYTMQALQMKALGFTMNLAPVAEVCTPDNEVFLNQRSFGNLEQVKLYGGACVHAYESNGVGTVLKHFPGNTNTDPHTGLPEIKWSEQEMKMQLEGFKALVQKNPSAVLMSHARVNGYDEENPACLSHYWVTDILRNELGFEGIIFSDDIFMGALADNGYPPEVAVVAAIEAGIDCIMISEKRIDSSVKILCRKAKTDSDFAGLIDKAVRRIIDYKLNCGFLSIELDDSGQYGVVIHYPEFTGQGFEEAKEMNVKLYMENF